MENNNSITFSCFDKYFFCFLYHFQVFLSLFLSFFLSFFFALSTLAFSKVVSYKGQITNKSEDVKI